MTEINNVSEVLEKYVVARRVDNEYWFWGTYDEVERATRAAKEIDGVIFESKDVSAV